MQRRRWTKPSLDPSGYILRMGAWETFPFLFLGRNDTDRQHDGRLDAVGRLVDLNGGSNVRAKQHQRDVESQDRR